MKIFKMVTFSKLVYFLIKVQVYLLVCTGISFILLLIFIPLLIINILPITVIFVIKLLLILIALSIVLMGIAEIIKKFIHKKY